MNRILLLIICCLSLSGMGFAQWKPSNNGLYGGSISALTIDPTTDYIYAGTNYGGVFLSTDNGSSWTGLNNTYNLTSLM